MNLQTVNHSKWRTRLYSVIFKSTVSRALDIIIVACILASDRDAAYCKNCGSLLKGGGNIQ